MPDPPEHSVDLLYLACNRLEFTRETFTTLIANTDWQYINELVVYDDGSTDGTLELLEELVMQVPARTRLVRTSFGSPVTAMVDFIENANAPMLAKTDNDAMLPAGWLRQSLQVMEDHPELTLLGIEAMYPHVDDTSVRRSYLSAEFISGLGLYRRSAFAASRPTAYDKWFGLEEWQMIQPRLTRGWINPALPVFLLDRLPHEPWSRHSDNYISRGWQRPWQRYDPDCPLWRWRWPELVPEPATDLAGQTGLAPIAEICPERGPDTANFSIVILSAQPANLISCVRSILASEPDFPPNQIIVVDDGARAAAEPMLPSVRWVDGVKPFIYARNANLGILEAAGDVILLNDDADLITPGGFNSLAAAIGARPTVGVCSAAVRGLVGNPNQLPAADGRFRIEPKMLAFICVYIPRTVYERIGPLDERFTGYGFEDNDYCARVTAAGLQLGIWEGCAVDHSGRSPSTFRTRPDIGELGWRNKLLFDQKWATASALVENTAQSPQSRFLTAMRIKNEAGHIAEVVRRALLFSGRVFVFDDNSTDDTREICRSFGDCVTVFASPFQGLDEARDKNYLLQRIVEASPEWVLWIDGDEVLELAGPDRLARATETTDSVSAFYLKIAYLWNDPHHVRVDGIFGKFKRLSLFRLRGQPTGQLFFPATQFGANFHCGNVPRGLVGNIGEVNVCLKHYGYMTPAQRQAKYHWYTLMDPDNHAEDHYRHLADIPGARFAPGPPRIIPWSE